MKRFVIEIGLGIVMISMGIAISFFELQDYKVENYFQNESYSFEKLETTVSETNPLHIRFQTYLPVQYVFEERRDDKVIIELNEAIEYTFENNELRIKRSNIQDISGKEELDIFVEGLKEEKLYTFDRRSTYYDESITIYCPKDLKKYVNEL